MTAVIETNDLGKQYGRKWALRNCALSIPEGKVATSFRSATPSSS